SGGHATVYKSANWRFLAVCNGRLMAQDLEKGLLTFENEVWTPFINTTSLPADVLFTSAFTLSGDSTLLATRKNGLFLLSGKQLNPIRSPFLDQVAGKYISGISRVNATHFAVITNLEGCYIIDIRGNLIQSFSIREGLQNNNLLSIFLDKEKNIWLGLDNGIDCIAYNNAIRHIYPENLNESSGYASIIHNDHLYIGTANGLYRVRLDGSPDLSFVKGRFEPVENTNGQVWNLSEVNNNLYLGHHDGGFLIRENKATLVDNTSGFWNFMPLSNVLPSSTVISGTYHGINFYTARNGLLNRQGQAPFESARFVVVDNGAIWSSHPYKGIFKVTQNANGELRVQQYGKKEGVASVNGNYIFKIKNRIILTTESGILEYNAARDRFESSPYYNAIFGTFPIRYLKEDPSGNIWFVYDKVLGVVDFSQLKPQIIYLPELTNKMVSGFESVYPVNEQNVFIGGEKGFYHINYEQYRKNTYDLVVQIRTVKAIGKTDSLLFGGYLGEANELKKASLSRAISIDHSWNSMHFEFASPTYAQQASIEYSYYLEGFDKKWSEFSKKTEKEYTNLPAGNYVFSVKVRNNLGSESAITRFPFTVLPPWYETLWAYLAYGILIIVGFFFLFRQQKLKFQRQRMRFEEEQKRLQYLHQLELEKNEKEIIKLRNEKLEAEIQHKNTELASTAMHLLQKGELLTKIKEDITRLNKQKVTEPSQDELKKIIKTLNEEDKMDKDWEHFSKHFDKVHSNFLVSLKEKFPLLSPNEMKLCAYLRMNLSSKEIAQLMNISVRGVEISRYRLRKKLQLQKEMNLFDYLISIHPLENN
ncbi:MAG TPA: triple tyrosine motif-containing protein, partial [Flavisolibacter sp.]|nr:triple tyrosine motif-containing protein [Flavisolibacter sp.]